MKKIIIVNNNLAIGGVQTSLVNLLGEMRDQYDVTLLLFHVAPQDLARVPKGVRVVTVRSPFRHFGMSRKDTKGNPLLFLTRAFWVVLSRLLGRHAAVRLMLPLQKRLTGYDCAISYLHEASPKQLYGGCNEFVLYRIDAPQKVTWLHGDFSRCGANYEKSRALYRRFDQIVACSEGTRRAFLACMPECEARCVAVRNCNDYEGIRALAEQAVEPCEQAPLRVVTVARLSSEKGIDRALLAVKYCKDHGQTVIYDIVGEGKEHSSLVALTERLGITDRVTFYGDRSNPYPYVKRADLFLLTSHHEAAPMVFDEAACLGTPVLTTETTSAEEMVGSCGGGFVVKNEQTAIERALLAIAQDKHCLDSVRQTLAERVFDNARSCSQLQMLIAQEA